MKGYPFAILFFLALGSVLISSCQIETQEELELHVLEGQNYVDNHDTPPFFYHYEEKNRENHHTRGWLIDNQGYLRKYENVSVKLFEENNLASMNAFLDQTEIVAPIDLNLLVKHYKKNLSLSRITPTQYALQNSIGNTSTYYAYTLSYPNEDGTNTSNVRNKGFYNRFILESEGENTVVLDHVIAHAILRYLKDTAKDKTF